MLNGVIRSEDVIYFVVVVTLFLTFTTFKLTSDRRTISRFRQAISYLGFLSQQWQLAISLHVGNDQGMGYNTHKTKLTYRK